MGKSMCCNKLLVHAALHPSCVDHFANAIVLVNGASSCTRTFIPGLRQQHVSQDSAPLRASPLDLGQVHEDSYLVHVGWECSDNFPPPTGLPSVTTCRHSITDCTLSQPVDRLKNIGGFYLHVHDSVPFTPFPSWAQGCAQGDNL